MSGICLLIAPVPVHCFFITFISVISSLHITFNNIPIQYTAILHGCEKDNIPMKNCDIFLMFAQNIDLWYTFEPAL